MFIKNMLKVHIYAHFYSNFPDKINGKWYSFFKFFFRNAPKRFELFESRVRLCFQPYRKIRKTKTYRSDLLKPISLVFSNHYHVFFLFSTKAKKSNILPHPTLELIKHDFVKEI